MNIVSIEQDTFAEVAPFTWGLTLFCFGCNLKCKMCQGYNYEQVTDKNNIIGRAKELIDKNVTPFHDTVIFIGGEPTIWGSDLIEALKYVKSKNLHTKIFTNGMKPDVINYINNNKLCDAWSIDYKGIFSNTEEELGISNEEYVNNIWNSIDNVVEHKLPLEIRTTIYDENRKDRDLIEASILEYINIAKKKNGYDYFIKWIEQHDFRKFIK